MKALIVTIAISLLAGCAGMGARSSGGMGTNPSQERSTDSYYGTGATGGIDRAQPGDVFHSWIN